MRIALYQPDIPQNTGAIIRLAACFGSGVDLIGPFGFVVSSARFRRSAMDYIDHVDWCQHRNWREFRESVSVKARCVLLSRHGGLPYCDWAFRDDDVLILGRETAGFPQELRNEVDAVLTIPIRSALRSMNQAMAASIVAAEAMRQLGWPELMARAEHSS